MEVPTAPSVPARPWLIVLASGFVSLVALLACVLGVFAVSFLDAALHPERVRIGYKA